VEPNFIPLVEVPRILRDEYKTEVTYRQVYNLALDGSIGAVKDPQSGRWKVPEDQLIFVRGHI
jgi:hypothetical protein